MMAKTHVKQHVVPQSYLKRFAEKNTNNKGHHIGVRREDKGKVDLFIKAIDDIAYIDNYYDISTREDPKYWEHFFAENIEPLYGRPLENIIAKITLSGSKNNVLSKEDKLTLGKMIAFQLVRVPSFLNPQLKNGVEMCNDMIDQTLKIYGAYLTKEQIKAIQALRSNEDFVKDTAFGLLSNPERLTKYAEILSNKIWTIDINNTDIPFCTSDNPVLLYNMVTHEIGLNNNGIGRQDSMITFPLSSKILLQIFSLGELLSDTNEFDGRIISLGESEMKFITEIDMLQIQQASKESYMEPRFLEVIKNMDKASS